MADSINADIIEAKDLHITKLEGYDLIGFGSGIYKGKFHKNILDLLEKLPQVNDRKAFVFSTSGLGKLSYNAPVEEALKKHGFGIIGSFTCKGYNTLKPINFFGGLAKGRPNEDDFKNAKEFAQKLMIS